MRMMESTLIVYELSTLNINEQAYINNYRFS